MSVATALGQNLVEAGGEHVVIDDLGILSQDIEGFGNQIQNIIENIRT